MPNDIELVNFQRNQLLQTTVGDYQNQLIDYLKHLGLPDDNVLVCVEERGTVIQNLPAIINRLSVEKRAGSFYISKFIAACGSGLFDSALNYIWNETIENLREKVGLFDLEFFKSTVKDEDKKKKILSIENLNLIDEWDLVKGCHLTGIISDIGYKHLDYIREMRNWASAAHPNHASLTGMQLCAWLQTCIIEVIGKEPSLPAIEAKRLLQNLRNNVLSSDDVTPIGNALQKSPVDIVTSIFRTIFGMFCDPSTKVETKNNIRLIAKDIWSVLPENSKKEAGVKYANWAVNADLPRRNLAREFLEQVNALSYLPKDTLCAEMAETIDNLLRAHYGFNNFHNEPPYAKMLRKLVPENGAIPSETRFEYVKTLCLCMVGNAYGTSNEAYPIYIELFNKFTDQEIKIYVSLFSDNDFSLRMQYEKCTQLYRGFVNTLLQRTTNEIVKRVIQHISSQTHHQLNGLGKTTEYRKLIDLLK